MADEILTMATWRVKPGNESTFMEAWLALGDYFATLPHAPGEGVLLQSTTDDHEFCSFGPWPSLEAIHAMRADPEATRMLQGLADLCEQAHPGTFKIVARSRHAIAEPRDRLRHAS